MKQPRVIACVERPLYNVLVEMAKTDGISLSLKIRDMLKKQIEMEMDDEDAYWGKIAESRMHEKPVPFDEAWRRIAAAHKRKSK